MKIYTKQGDTGKTSLLTERVSKTNPRIDAIGVIDELMVIVGGFIMELQKEQQLELNNHVQFIYRNLFIIQSSLADSEKKYDYHIENKDITFLESEIDRMTEVLPKLKHFICYTGVPLAMTCHELRSKVRTVERKVVGIYESEEADPALLIYLNRLSDYFYTLARFLNLQNGYEEDIIKL